jgi:hypothetical protein
MRYGETADAQRLGRQAGPVKTILITGIGGPAGAALSIQIAERTKRDPRRRWIGVDVVDVGTPHLDAFDLVALAADPDYAPSMRAVFARHAPDLVIPTVSDELPQVAILAELLGLTGPVAGGEGHIVSSASGPTSVAWDKLLTMWALERAGVPVPRYAPATRLPSTAAAIDLLGAPFVIKPRVSRGGRGVRLIESADAAWPAGDGSWIAQGFAPGTEYNPQVYRSQITGESTVVILEKTVLKQGRVGNAAEVVRLAAARSRRSRRSRPARPRRLAWSVRSIWTLDAARTGDRWCWRSTAASGRTRRMRRNCWTLCSPSGWETASNGTPQDRRRCHRRDTSCDRCRPHVHGAVRGALRAAMAAPTPRAIERHRRHHLRRAAAG